MEAANHENPTDSNEIIDARLTNPGDHMIEGNMGEEPLRAETAGHAGSIARRFSRHTGIGNARNAKQPHPETLPLSGDAIASLGGLEAEVLGILWEFGRAATSMEVMETSLYKARALGNEPPSFSTIATTLRRLSGKGLLKNEKIDGRTPVFWPTVEREQMAARILNNVSATLLGVSLHSLLPRLIGPASRGRGVTGEARGTKKANSREPKAEDEEEIARLLKALEETAARSAGVKPEE